MHLPNCRMLYFDDEPICSRDFIADGIVATVVVFQLPAVERTVKPVARIAVGYIVMQYNILAGLHSHAGRWASTNCHMQNPHYWCKARKAIRWCYTIVNLIMVACPNAIMNVLERVHIGNDALSAPVITPWSPLELHTLCVISQRFSHSMPVSRLAEAVQLLTRLLIAYIQTI